MALDPITAIFETGKMAIEKIWPDANKRAEQLQQLEELRLTGDLARLDAHVKLLLAQIKVNEEATKHKSLFVAGARPAILWICAFGLGYSGIFYELFLWFWTIFSVYAEVPASVTAPPKPDSEHLYPLLFGLLGIGGMRSFDKSKGVETNSINN